APQSSQNIALSSAVSKGETLTVNNINDYGADVAVKVAVK
ncbi:molecular chaperone, partial [Citrobacter freundii]